LRFFRYGLAITILGRALSQAHRLSGRISKGSPRAAAGRRRSRHRHADQLATHLRHFEDVRRRPTVVHQQAAASAQGHLRSDGTVREGRDDGIQGTRIQCRRKKKRRKIAPFIENGDGASRMRCRPCATRRSGLRSRSAAKVAEEGTGQRPAQKPERSCGPTTRRCTLSDPTATWRQDAASEISEMDKQRA